ncbi:MAG: TolC family protein [Sulfurimonadaceae bacterium]|jgi:hypothetical protein|nr:TolC family protein [Sulfurimonadaceae bacterium]
MKIKVFLLIFVSINLFAQNLNEIIQSLEMGKRVTSMKEQTKADIAQVEYFDSYDAPYLGFNLSHADESNDKGFEYAVGISQDIAHPFASNSKTMAVQAKTKAIEQGSLYALDVLSLEIAKKYHLACISKEMSVSAQKLYDEQNESFFKLQKAYELGEISKKELLFNKLDLVNTKRSVTTHKRAYITELSDIQKVVENLDIEYLECSDLMKITKEIELKSVEEHTLLKEISYEQSSAKSFYDLHNSSFSTIGYELLYEKELDNKTRYTFGLNIPLDVLSSKTQKQRAEYLHRDASLIAGREALILEIQNGVKSSITKLRTLYEEFLLLEEEIVPMSLELKDLAKKSLREGHSSVLEYLDATRSYSKISLELQEIKKGYYEELFELYKRADMKGKL